MKKAFLTLGLAIAVGAAAIAPAGAVKTAKADTVMTADVWIIAGQSNAAGWSNLGCYGIGGTQVSHDYRADLTARNEKNKTGYPNVLFYGSGLDWSANSALPAMSLTPVKMGTNLQAGTVNHVGPEPGMASVLSENYTAENPAVLVKYAVGGTYLGDFGGIGSQTRDYGNWASPTMTKKAKTAGKSLHANNGLLYSRLLQTTEGAFAALKAKGLTPSVKGYIWMQGEADAGNQALANAYEENLTDFINDLRADIATLAEDESAANRPFVVGQINSSGAYGGYISTVRAAEKNAAEQLSDVYTVDTDTYSIVDKKTSTVVGSDQWHFNANDMYDLGRRFATTALENMSKYTYRVSAGAGGTAAEKVLHSMDGEAVTLTVTANRGKTVDQVLLNGTDIAATAYANGVVTITPESSHGAVNDVEITFRDLQKYSLTVNLGKGGRISSREPSGSVVYEGDVLSVMIAPENGYEVDTVLLNDAPMTESNGRYTAVLEAKDYVLKVTFKQKAEVPPPQTEQPEEKNLPAWGIALIVIGSMLVAAGAAAGSAFAVLQHKKKDKHNGDTQE